jgi:hypothetical protein
VRFAEKMALDWKSADAAFRAEMLEHFAEAEVAELGMMIGQDIALGRLLHFAGANKMACEIYTPNY